MPLQTTNINLTTTPAPVINSTTTWANTRGASLSDPVSFAMVNSGVTPIRIGGASVSTVAGVGFPVSSGGSFTWDIRAAGEGLFAVTSASTSNIDVIADRQ